MHLKLPGSLAKWSVQVFANAFKIRLDEAEKPLIEYPSIGDFFVRKLKPGLRPIAEGPLVHPADSRISQIGEIVEGRCVQAKGKTYSVSDLCGDPKVADKFASGLMVTYYLCPTDYHRVHSPIEGVIKKVTHIPGALWPVNDWSRTHIENLFGKNERVVLEIESRLGPCLLVFVGATNVGQIRLAFDSQVVTNVGCLKNPIKKDYSPGISIQKGDELGLFSMGSTVVMLYPKAVRLQKDDWETFLINPVKMGEALL